MRRVCLRAFMAVCVLCCAISLVAEDSARVSHQITLTVAPGEHWTNLVWFGPIPVRKNPQVAAWIETASGEYVTTLAVTASSANQHWVGNPDGGRPEALPVWSAARGSGIAISLDAVTSATPRAGLTQGSSLDSLIAGKDYRIRFEINASFDYNEAWPKKAKKGEKGYSGVNGQPSIVYESVFRAGSKSLIENLVLRPVGTGSVDGASALITPGIGGLSTALEIVQSVSARIE
jgi:hypothetical protein